jgi:hypothetical protein
MVRAKKRNACDKCPLLLVARFVVLAAWDELDPLTAHRIHRPVEVAGLSGAGEARLSGNAEPDDRAGLENGQEVSGEERKWRRHAPGSENAAATYDPGCGHRIACRYRRDTVPLSDVVDPCRPPATWGPL